uniref:Uncharacterized protein n=1 Tax=Caenorhabditis japonica TaxID=281687 RepID=A0A8R1DU62_CAEJA
MNPSRRKPVDEKDIAAKLEGPLKQFLVLVGDDDGMISAKLAEKSGKVQNEPDAFYIANLYYSAKYGLKNFRLISDVSDGFRKKKVHMPCLFVVYKSMSQLGEAAILADEIETDMRVLIFESEEKRPMADTFEESVCRLGFEIVYLKPSSQQIADANLLSEKTGVDRLIECLEVTNWPWRIANTPKFQENSSLLASEFNLDSPEEFMKDELDEDGLEMLMTSYARWAGRQDWTPEELGIPAPQHAERVHLSPDSPTTTEGTVNQDDATISVDIDLVCSKNNENADQRSEEKSREVRNIY